MKLYYSPGACSLSPHIALREAGLAFELVKTDLHSHKIENGSDYRDINPKGYVPALLLDDGQLLTEGPVIVQYIADRVPEKRLAPPAGSMERYRLMEWLNYITSELHKTFSPLFNKQASEDWKEAARKLLDRRIEFVAKTLEGRDYLTGQAFTVADCYLFTVLNWAQWVQVDLSRWPVLAAYVQRVAARPAVQAALRAEGLLTA
ncbi:MAG: Glutathione S-transferase GstA [Rhodocyclaceae bacterium]|nr:MAG: glutathione transferase GstA [Rhodocyclaceae bacterium]MBE7424385.1 glutathione transferase GstA [Zoogloeaceae bacterium]MBV6408558.1 Glutathione S-transferase GstA [Rhodocyclaceae bacterium]MCK6384672.1 glutathione transferase GstA [Rhodocyclaceae bacterium]CAG0945422.1 glutathione S-transferase [Gammaproteobacteria bacterium]